MPDPPGATQLVPAARGAIFDPAPAKGWLPWGALAPVLALAFVVASGLAGEALIEPFVRLDAKGNPVDPAGLMAFALVPFGLLLVLLLVWVRFVERRPLASIGFAGPGKARAWLRGGAVGLASLLGVVAAIALAGGYVASLPGHAWVPPAGLLTVALLLPCLVLQSGVEELLFRGWLLSVLSRKFNVATGVIVSSALFALLHMNRGQPWPITVSNILFALFCCRWALASRSVLGVMGWHAAWNWLLAVGFGLPLTGLDVGIPSLLVELRPVGPVWMTGGTEGPEGSVACIAWFVGASVAIHVAAIARRPRDGGAEGARAAR